MKHLFFAVAMLAVSINGSAQSLTPVYEGSNNNYFFTIIPQEYSFNNQTNIVGTRYDSFGTYVGFDIFDENFNQRKSIVLPDEFNYGVSVTSMELKDTVVSDSNSPLLVGTFDNIEAAFLYIGDHYDAIETEDGRYKIDVRYYDYEKYENKYPSLYYIYTPETKELVMYRTSYETARIYIPGTQTTYYESAVSMGAINPRITDVTGNEERRCVLSQTLFNNDSKYEYMQYIIEPKVNRTENILGYTTDNLTEETVVGTRETYLPICKGVKIVSEDGTELNRILFNVENAGIAYGISGDESKIIDLGAKKYLVFRLYVENSSYMTLVYSFDDISTGAKLVSMTKGPRVSPTIANRSEMITVELEGENSQGREVSVVNVAGQTVMKTMIPAGQKSTQINASALSQGLNLLNVKGEQGATKIIIK